MRRRRRARRAFSSMMISEISPASVSMAGGSPEKTRSTGNSSIGNSSTGDSSSRHRGAPAEPQPGRTAARRAQGDRSAAGSGEIGAPRPHGGVFTPREDTHRRGDIGPALRRCHYGNRAASHRERQNSPRRRGGPHRARFEPDRNVVDYPVRSRRPRRAGGRYP